MGSIPTPATIFRKMKYSISATILYLFLAGWILPLEKYITPESGVGYALGIVGASAMLSLLSYSARKRIDALWKLSPLKNWMNLHIFLGLFGPLCILYHCRYSLGAPNSNIALFSMLSVAGSGVVGRYLYNTMNKKLFAMWHVAHLPFVFILAIAAIVHVIASILY